MYVACVYGVGTNLSVGSRVSKLILSLLVVGLSLVPSLAVLVPVVLRDAHGSVPASKSYNCLHGTVMFTSE